MPAVALANTSDGVVELDHEIFESEKKNKKSPLVLIHGLLGSGRNWAGLIKTFRRERTVSD